MTDDERLEPWEEMRNERRYLAFELNKTTLTGPSRRIVQGYYEKPYDFCVRIVDDRTAAIIRTYGRGEQRRKRHVPIGLGEARYLINSTPYVVRKTRAIKDGWKVDVFDRPLDDIVLIEPQVMIPGAAIAPPPWAPDAEDVTDWLTNRHLAHVTADLALGSDELVRTLLPRPVRRIVLTGGPCSGKTSMMRLFQKDPLAAVHCVPEAATILIEQIGAKFPASTAVGQRRFQRTIYRLQQNFEREAKRQACRDGKSVLLVDRGTVDNAAYMTGGIAELEQVCQTSIADEYARYHGVVCLEVPPTDVYERDKDNNGARYETYEQAVALGERIKRAWSGHPRFTLVGNDGGWDRKVASARAAINALFTE